MAIHTASELEDIKVIDIMTEHAGAKCGECDGIITVEIDSKDERTGTIDLWITCDCDDTVADSRDSIKAIRLW